MKLRTAVLVPIIVSGLALVTAVHAQQADPAFQAGLADRLAWEDWFTTTSGDGKEGAAFWAAHRSDPHPPSCYASDGQSVGGFTAGCVEAQKRLAPIDARRRTEPAYRLGFNLYEPPTAPPPAAAAIPPADVQADTGAIAGGMKHAYDEITAPGAAPAIAPAPASDAPTFEVVGHNGNWTIEHNLNHQGCMMSASSTDGRYKVGIAVTTDGSVIGLIHAPAAGVGPAPIVAIAGPNGELLFNKQTIVTPSDNGGSVIGTRLSEDDKMRLWEKLMIAAPDRVHVNAGPAASFDVDVTGASDAYANTTSCAGN